MTSKVYKTGSVTIYVDYGYDMHSITFSRRTYERLLKRKSLTIKGQGFHWDGEFDQDYWQFDFDDLEPSSSGRLYVSTEGDGDIYSGHLNDGEVTIEED